MILKATELYKAFGPIKAVEGLSFSVHSGDLYGLLGPNGAGKSTTIRMLLSLIKADKGTIEMMGLNMPDKRMNILAQVGALIERPDFYEYLSAFKNLDILARYSGLSLHKHQILEVLDVVGLAHRAESKVKTFSQGMKQRLGIAQAMLHQPKLLILDEPSNGLDPQGKKDLRDLLLKLNKEHDKTIILSSHLLHEVELICNRMVIINRGKAIVEGKVDELLHQGVLPVKVRVDDVPKALACMQRQFPDCESKKTDKDTLTIMMPVNNSWQLNEQLVNHGIKVLELQTSQNLEEFFLQHT